MVREVTHFVTANGGCFETRREAEEAELIDRLTDWFMKNDDVFGAPATCRGDFVDRAMRLMRDWHVQSLPDASAAEPPVGAA